MVQITQLFSVTRENTVLAGYRGLGNPYRTSLPHYVPVGGLGRGYPAPTWRVTVTTPSDLGIRRPSTTYLIPDTDFR